MGPASSQLSPPPSLSSGSGACLLASGRRCALHLASLKGGEAFVISIPVEEEHDTSDVVVHAAPPVPLRHFLELLYADTLVFRRSLQDTLRGRKGNRGTGE